ncbi:ABC transporter permease [Inconstantimicrobium mannanitabidum]|uniref:Uncharacterized protein n=1 Tax=Inconstantimicrobium mannanitabidum TaxID=1604901 RepID=A0ACB5RFB6_9CLOT|nr:ABC transporter permease [Clostridium sp. TW13]GKX67749.1 hypothetical protein rsdtw13_30070 [Clostridium sp. TW13]
MLKKIFLGTKFIFVCIVIMVFFSFTMIINITNIQESYKEHSSSDTKNMLYLGFTGSNEANHIDSDGDEKDDKSKMVSAKKAYIDFLKNVRQKKDIIIKVSWGNMGFVNKDNNVGLYFNGRYDCPYHILKGRFFTKEEMDSKDKKVVIGKDVLSQTIKEGDKTYILCGQDKYEVIGVVGKEKISTLYDDIILCNLTNFAEAKESIANLEWKIDSNVYDISQLRNIISTYDSNHLLMGTSDEMPAALKQSLRYNTQMFISTILIGIAVFLGLVQATVYWIENLKLEIGIRKKCGARDFEILCLIMKRYFIVSIVATIISLGILEFAKNIFKFEFLQYADFNLMLKILFVQIIAVGLIPCMVFLFNIRKASIGSLLREE